ncbi:hypothetical protein JCM19235_2019 [Vibrio maritimus]|uniref:Uncharacterized protein n=1 Tax=Vibrio maritimus TaxID=990268 RepID=A0A090RTI6_9VIBR|nr:hypothetical protein JCM19235_2019 [Vibrio maritimus]
MAEVIMFGVRLHHRFVVDGSVESLLIISVVIIDQDLR